MFAVHEVKEAVKYVSHLNGGNACVRDVIEKVLKLNDGKKILCIKRDTPWQITLNTTP